MAVYNCECGLIISTSSERPRCLRCLRILNAQNLANSVNAAGGSVTAVAVAVVRQPLQFRQVTMGYRLNERPVIPPLVRPK